MGGGMFCVTVCYNYSNGRHIWHTRYISEFDTSTDSLAMWTDAADVAGPTEGGCEGEREVLVIDMILHLQMVILPCPLNLIWLETPCTAQTCVQLWPPNDQGLLRKILSRQQGLSLDKWPIPDSSHQHCCLQNLLALQDNKYLFFTYHKKKTLLKILCNF